MSETEKPQPDQEPGPVQSGAEAPEQHAEAPPAQPTAPTQPTAEAAQPPPAAEAAAQAQPVLPPPAPPAPRRPPRLVRTGIAAGIGAVLLLAGGVGGYFIGAASDHDRDRPGVSRFGDHFPGPGYRDFPGPRNR